MWRTCCFSCIPQSRSATWVHQSGVLLQHAPAELTLSEGAHGCGRAMQPVEKHIQRLSGALKQAQSSDDFRMVVCSSSPQLRENCHNSCPATETSGHSQAVASTMKELPAISKKLRSTGKVRSVSSFGPPQSRIPCSKRTQGFPVCSPLRAHFGTANGT